MLHTAALVRGQVGTMAAACPHGGVPIATAADEDP